MENKNSQLERALDDFEKLIAEIVSDPKVQTEMLKIQPIDVEKN